MLEETNKIIHFDYFLFEFIFFYHIRVKTFDDVFKKQLISWKTEIQKRFLNVHQSDNTLCIFIQRFKHLSSELDLDVFMVIC